MTRKLVHFTPLRYPGGKGKLASFVKELLTKNALVDGDYVEPYAGGAAIGLELLQQDYVSRVHINDISRPLYCFWDAVLNHTEQMAKRVRDAKLSVTTWRRQRTIFANHVEHDDLAVGFAAFYLNRTNRSGILNGGPIGGLDQSGPWKIDARFNGAELAGRIESIGRFRNRVTLACEDAVLFLERRIGTLPRRTLIYLDPPYYAKGKALYYDYYTAEDHVRIAGFVQREIREQKWMVSYDNVAPIKALYAGCTRKVYRIGYSARDRRTGAEVMFLGPGLAAPQLRGPMRQSREADERTPLVRNRRVRYST